MQAVSLRNQEEDCSVVLTRVSLTYSLLMALTTALEKGELEDRTLILWNRLKHVRIIDFRAHLLTSSSSNSVRRYLTNHTTFYDASHESEIGHLSFYMQPDSPSITLNQLSFIIKWEPWLLRRLIANGL